jgi:hypothetical protein
MELREIRYVYNNLRYTAKVQLLSPLTWIFLVNSDHAEPFHLEYDEVREKWVPIEENLEDKKLISSIGMELTKIYGRDIERTVSQSKFSSLDFFIADNRGQDIICFWDSELRIRVTSLTGSPLFLDPKELVFYGDDNGTPLVFQTIDYQGQDTEIILDAIKWYAEYLEYPDMIVSKDNPLSGFQA